MAVNILLLLTSTFSFVSLPLTVTKMAMPMDYYCRVLGLLNSHETFLSQLEIWVQNQLGVGKTTHCCCVGIGMSHVPIFLLWAPHTLGLKIFYRAGPRQSTFFFLNLSWRARSILWHMYLYFFTYVFSSNTKAG